MKIRSFIAIDVDETIKDELRNIQCKLQQTHLKHASVKWVEASQTHLTIKFLGEIEECLIEKVNAIIARSTTSVPPFEVHISGLGAFPNLNKPRVITVNVQDESLLLKKIFNGLEQELPSIGVEAEKREFKPHLTLGRVKKVKERKGSGDGRSLKDALQELADVDLGTMKVSEVVLFRSQLTPRGAIYTVLNRASLA